METEKILLRVPDSLKEELRIKAKKMGVSVNALILQILWNWKNKEINQ